MARGGGGGGHSGGGSFGGHSGGSSFSRSGGSRGSSFSGGGYRSSSYHSGPSYHHGPSHHYGPGPGYHPGPGYYGGPRPPRRYYGSRSSSSSGCGLLLVVVIIIMMVVFNSITTAISGISCAANSSLTKNTEKREKMSTANTSYCNTWFVDELGWIGRGNKLVDGLEYFYQKTGVQPLVYIYAYDDTNTWNSEKLSKEKAEEIYSEIFGNDEGHLLFVYFACPNDSPNIMDGNFQYICGKQTEVVMDENAKDILESRYWYYYDDTSLTVEELFGKTFKQAGKTIMSGPVRMRNVVIIIVAIVAGVIVVSIMFKWWKAKKIQKNKESEDLEKILSTPLETFGKTEADNLKDKYNT